MKTLYMATAGAADPTKASLAFHLAVNGSAAVGQSVDIVLAGDATELLRADVRDRVEGLGLPALRDLIAKARQHELSIYV